MVLFVGGRGNPLTIVQALPFTAWFVIWLPPGLEESPTDLEGAEIATQWLHWSWEKLKIDVKYAQERTHF